MLDYRIYHPQVHTDEASRWDYRVEIVYRDVAGIAEAEVLGVKRIIGRGCFCVVEPQTAETLTVRFVVPSAD